VILEVARENPTDGTRMVAALAGRELGGCSATGPSAGGAGRGSSESSAPISSGTWT